VSAGARRASARESRPLLAIAAGGVLGALGRYELSVALPSKTTGFPWGTWLANISGAFVLAGLLVVLADRWPHNRYARPFLGTGVLGSYTTFSTFAVESDLLFRAGHWLLAASYVITSVASGLLAGWLGGLAGRRVVPPGPDAVEPMDPDE